MKLAIIRAFKRRHVVSLKSRWSVRFKSWKIEEPESKFYRTRLSTQWVFARVLMTIRHGSINCTCIDARNCIEPSAIRNGIAWPRKITIPSITSRLYTKISFRPSVFRFIPHLLTVGSSLVNVTILCCINNPSTRRRSSKFLYTFVRCVFFWFWFVSFIAGFFSRKITV